VNPNSDPRATNYGANIYSESIAPEELPAENLEDNLESSRGERLFAPANESESGWRNKVQIAVRSLRRFGASTIELALLVMTAGVPASLGWYVNHEYTGKLVPLNPLLEIAVDRVGESLSLPGCPQQSVLYPDGSSNLNPQVDRSEVVWCSRSVAPLTNLLWSMAIAAPILMAIAHIYQLGKTGQTLPKRWLKIQVVTDSGKPPGLLRAFWRDPVGRWAVPVTIAYGIWWWTGAIPDLLIFAGLAIAIWIIDGINAVFDRQQRTLHDLLARTLVVETRIESQPEMPWQLDDTLAGNRVMADEMEPEAIGNENSRMIDWIRSHQEISLVAGILLTVIAILTALVGTQMYVQKQANWRSRQAQANEKFLKLVDKFAIDERQGAILALGSLNHPEAGIKMLTDLLGLSDDPKQIETISQALVSAGPDALPYLKKLNQALATDLDSLRYGGNEQEQKITALRQRSTQRAIGKILRLYSGEISEINLNRIDLGQNLWPVSGVELSDSAQFTLVLEKMNLSGIQLRGAILTGANFQGSQFYGPGFDRRFGTFDDTKADLSGAQLTEANLSQAFLTSAIMEKIDLSRANLNRANLSNTNLIDANLSSAQLVSTDLRYANLANAKLTGANLSAANLSQVELSNGRLSQITAKGANFQLANLSAADVEGSDLSETDLTNANLQNANLSATNLSGANLRNAQLQNANLQSVDLTGADLRGATLTGADVRGAIFATPKPENTDTFIAKSVDRLSIGLLQGVNFNEVKNLDLKQMSYLCTQGAVHNNCTLDRQP